MNYHWHLDSAENHRVVFAHGLGISDFAKPGPITLIDAFKRKQKHKDACTIFDSFKNYPQIPITFDGSLPSETFAKKPKSIKVGERYFFEDAGPNGLKATVTTATVDETNKTMYVGTDTGAIITRPMTDNELSDYSKHNDFIFGKSQRQGFYAKDIFEFYENLVKIHLSYPRENLQKQMSGFMREEALNRLSFEDLVLIYCERIATSTSVGKQTVKK